MAVMGGCLAVARDSFVGRARGQERSYPDKRDGGYLTDTPRWRTTPKPTTKVRPAGPGSLRRPRRPLRRLLHPVRPLRQRRPVPRANLGIRRSAVGPGVAASVVVAVSATARGRHRWP